MTAALFSLQGRVALVTGASAGLGRAVAVAFAQAGALVLVNGRDAQRAAQVVDALVGQGLSAASLVFDIADAQARSQALHEAQARWGRIDVLVNNVGQRLRAPLGEISGDDFNRLLDVNLGAVYALTQAVAAGMLQRQQGRILMMTSIAAQLGRAGDAAYTSAKGGLAALTRALACELGPHGITCNAIAPGAFLTEPNLAAAAGADGEAFCRRTPLRRWGQAAEIAGPALFLASDAASYVNGHVLTVDGGYSIAF